MSGTWTFGSLFIPQFHRRFGRYPTEQELADAELSWMQYLQDNGKPPPYNTARVRRDYNGAGQVVNEYLAPS